LPWLFAASLLLTSALLFIIQPIIGKLLLPKFGGTPFVWVTCVLFFQAALLAGYAYVHLTTRRLSERRQKVVHGVVLLAALVALPLGWVLWPFAGAPLGIADAWAPPGNGQPVFWLVLLLALTIGLPFFALSATAPLLQRWFAGTGFRSARDPYYLYAASNLGSILPLVTYPWLIEPAVGLAAQGWLWLVGLVAAVALLLACLALLQRATMATDVSVSPKLPEPFAENVAPTPVAATAITANPPDTVGYRPLEMSAQASIPVEAASAEAGITPLQRLRWLAQAFVPASLMLALTTHFTTDIAPVPLFWVLPLAVYLLTMVIAFARLPRFLYRVFTLVMPLPVLAVLYMIQAGPTLFRVDPLTTFYYHLAVLFFVGLAFHGALAADRPATRYLTEFYLWLACGGFLGGVFNALLAPLMFNTVAEFSISLVLACMFMPSLGQGRPLRWAWLPSAVLLALLPLTALCLGGWRDAVLFQELLDHPPAPVLLALAGLICLCPVAAICAVILRKTEKIDAAMDFLLPVVVAGWTVALLIGSPRRFDGLTVLLVVCLLLLGVTAARAIIVASQGRWSSAIMLAWPLLFGLNLIATLWRGVDAAMNDIPWSSAPPDPVRPATYLVGLPLLMATVSLDRPIRFGLSLAAVLLVHALHDASSDADIVLHQERSFFGTYRVEQSDSSGEPLLSSRESNKNLHRFLHGTTLQGAQRFDSGHQDEPLAYYHRTGPLGEVLSQLEKRAAPPPIAAIGLGVGAVACYGVPGQEIAFYEIDPAVIRIARNPALFTHVGDAEKRGVRLQIVAGDGRLQLAQAADGHFGAIVVDAFNSDAVPTHLLTREALALYCRKLEPGGIIAVHVSNRYLDLPPILADLAADAGLVALERYDNDEESGLGKNSSDWVLLARQEADLKAVVDTSKWKRPTGRGVRVWTDDYTNVFDALRRYK
jgi:hypothetical protein